MGRMTVASEPNATPFEYWVSSLPGTPLLQLGDLVYTGAYRGSYGLIKYWGVVEESGAGEQFWARVRIVRTSPEVKYPPEPGNEVVLADAEHQAWAYHYSQMRRRIPAGLMASGEPAYLNLDFFDGTRGGHLNIAGLSGLATKTSYALFLLYGLMHQPTASDFRAVVFNVKGDDLLYLHCANHKLKDESRAEYEKLGLPCGPFPQVTYHGTQGAIFGLREFADCELIRFLFAESDPSGMVEFAIDHLAWALRREAALHDGPELVLQGQPVTSLEGLIERLCHEGNEAVDLWFDKAAASTRRAIVRRLRVMTPQVAGLVAPDTRFSYESRLNVVDIHRLSTKARAFVVGSVLHRLFEGRHQIGCEHPKVLVMLDELNQYAPRDNPGPIGRMLLEIAEIGRSLGILLLGAAQLASAVEERVVQNAAIRVAGRLDAAEASKDVFAWLGTSFRQLATMLAPGTMLLRQPQHVLPLEVRFPFPAWATRQSEAG